MRYDLASTNLGTIIRIEGSSLRGRTWLLENVPDSAGGDPVDCEHRCGVEILIGALDDGLTVFDTSSGRVAQRG